MNDPLQSYRQPMVTASGLMLGFTLNFAATWVQTENPMGMALAYFIGACVLFGTVCLIWAVFRILNHGYPRGEADRYYARTLALFIGGICMTFAGVFLDMSMTFMIAGH